MLISSLNQSSFRTIRILAVALFALMLVFTARPLLAQTAPDQAESAAGTPAAAPTAAASPAVDTTDAYVPMTPTLGKGMPVPAGIDVQKQYSPDGRFAFKFHTAMLWVMGVICLFVLALLLIVIFRFNARRNPVASKTTHNTTLEVVWTLLPVLILVAIAIPSIKLLAKQYQAPPKNAVTIKATGYQWYWTYTYPDLGGFEVDSKMLNVKGEPEINPGVRYDGTKPWDGPDHLEVDNRMVVPVGVPLRIQTTGADVIHSFAVPSLWFKLDAIPGRLNERLLEIDEPGVYYGQCSELCGAKHGFMPIAIEAVPMDKFRAWVRLQGGSFPGDKKPAAAEAAPAAGAVAEQPAAGTSPVAPTTPTPAAS